MWEKSTITKVCEIFDELSKYYVWVIPPYGKSRKIEKWQIIFFDALWKWFFSWTPFYKGDIIYLATIMRALMSNLFCTFA